MTPRKPVGNRGCGGCQAGAIARKQLQEQIRKEALVALQRPKFGVSKPGKKA